MPEHQAHLREGAYVPFETRRNGKLLHGVVGRHAPTVREQREIIVGGKTPYRRICRVFRGGVMKRGVQFDAGEPGPTPCPRQCRQARVAASGVEYAEITNAPAGVLEHRAQLRQRAAAAVIQRTVVGAEGHGDPQGIHRAQQVRRGGLRRKEQAGVAEMQVGIDNERGHTRTSAISCRRLSPAMRRFSSSVMSASSTSPIGTNGSLTGKKEP